MYVIFTIIVFIGAIVLQTSILHFIPIGGIIPDLVLVIIVYLGLLRGPETGCFSGFVFGLMQDALSNVPLGSNALSKTIIGFLCGMSGRRLYTQSLFSQILCIGFSTVVDVVLQLSIQGFGEEWRHMLLYETLYNILCCPFIVFIFRQGEKRLGVNASTSTFS
jgi:rod shape-determining protein MreD